MTTNGVYAGAVHIDGAQHHMSAAVMGSFWDSSITTTMLFPQHMPSRGYNFRRPQPTIANDRLRNNTFCYYRAQPQYFTSFFDVSKIKIYQASKSALLN
jgi:hypothetical protein